MKSDITNEMGCINIKTQMTDKLNPRPQNRSNPNRVRLNDAANVIFDAESYQRKIVGS